ncbi:MAG: immunoglobulin-like domain-containing protein, partial [Acholeplasmataceae bacterium]
MKKLGLLVIIFSMIFTVVACNRTDDVVDDVDTTKPVITGVTTIEISVGDTFDPLAGVTATDDVDGDLTASIVVSGDTVNVNRAGDYIVVYTVSDAAGNEAVKQRVVSVLGLAGFSNGDFSDGLDGWSTWVNESQGVAAAFSAADGVATIDITEQSIVNDNNWWDVQLSQKTLALTAFESYTLSFTVQAENARKMMVQVQGGGLSSKPISEQLVDITTEAVTYTFDFFAKEDSVGTELQFAFGTFHKVDGVPAEQQTVLGEIYLSNVQIIAGPELENQAPVLSVSTNILLPVGATSFLVKGGITVSDDIDDLTLDDVTYTDTSDVAFVIGQPAVKGTYTFEYSVTDSDGAITTATRTLFVADAFEIADFNEVNEETGVPVGWVAWHEDTRGGMTVTTTD